MTLVGGAHARPSGEGVGLLLQHVRSVDLHRLAAQGASDTRCAKGWTVESSRVGVSLAFAAQDPPLISQASGSACAPENGQYYSRTTGTDSTVQALRTSNRSVCARPVALETPCTS